MLSAQNVATYVYVEGEVPASFLIRFAPGPNNALKEAAYSGLKKDEKMTCRPKVLRL